MVDRIFPTREEVALLAHAREVDLHDTELMMGDDDGFLAVVIANRLPLPGHDADGNEVPVKYLACLVNLSEQLDSLLEKAPEPVTFTRRPFAVADLSAVSLADVDHATMGSTVYQSQQAQQVQDRTLVPHGGTPTAKAAGTAPTSTARANLAEGLAAPYEPAAGWTRQVARRRHRRGLRRDGAAVPQRHGRRLRPRRPARPRSRPGPASRLPGAAALGLHLHRGGDLPPPDGAA